MSRLNHDYKCYFLFVLRFENNGSKINGRNSNIKIEILYLTRLYINRAICTIT